MTSGVRRIDRGRSHHYLLDGSRVVGVTTAINGGVPKPALINWAASTTAEFVVDRLNVVAEPASGMGSSGRIVDVSAKQLVDELHNIAAEDGKGFDGFSRLGLLEALKRVRFRDLDAASNRGTEVHTLAEKLLHGEEVAVPEVLAGHVDSYLKFLDEWDIEPVLVETVVASRRWEYAGTLDLVAKTSKLDGPVLFDLKTSRSGVFSEVALQLAAYRFADVYVDDDGNERAMPKITGCFAVWVRADGFDVYPITANERAFRLFLYAKELASFVKGGRDPWIADSMWHGGDAA